MRGYARIAQHGKPVGALAALRRPALAALVLGVAIAAAGTGHVPPRLVMSTTLGWAPVILLQVAVALAVIGPPARGGVGVPRALDLFFAAQGPWSIWLLAVAAWAVVATPPGQPVRFVQETAVIPLAWTARLVYAFHVQVLGFSRGAAWRRTFVHQSMTIGAAVVVAGNSIFPRVVGLWHRWFAA